MQRVSAQVAPEAVDPRRPSSSAGSHYFEHPVSDFQPDLTGGHFRGGNIQCAPATLIVGNRVSDFPRSLQRLSRDVGEGLRCLKADKEAPVIRQNVGIVRGTL